jgi:flavin-dependent dehydrogenase
MNDQFDVAILGAGFEGGMLGTILAHSGAKVVIIDAGTHPRFALGESTVRHTFRMIKIMAERFGVPEFKSEFYSAELLHKHVSSQFGVKKNSASSIIVPVNISVRKKRRNSSFPPSVRVTKPICSVRIRINI